MSFSFECVALSHIGNHRKNNEDNFFIGKLLTLDEQRSMSQLENRFIQKKNEVDGEMNRIFAVSDGMGGYEDGEVASFIVTEALESFIQTHQSKAASKRLTKFSYIQAFQEMIQQTNQTLLESSGEIDNMGATLSGLIVFADEAAPFNIGDSSTFIYENGSLRKLTTDDNEANRFKKFDIGGFGRSGKSLIKYFGLPKSSGVLTAEISTPVILNVGQLFLISSDGLTDSLSHEKISQVLMKYSDDPEKVSMELIEAALDGENNGRDNITIVIVKIKKSF